MSGTAVRSLLGLIDAARAHNAAEDTGDLEATLATLEDDPLYELLPLGRSLRGADAVRRYYRHFFDDVVPRLRGFTLLSEWIGPMGVVQEYVLALAHEDGMRREHRVLGILCFGETRLTGERLYADDLFFKALLGPILAETQPMDSDSGALLG